MKRRIAIAVATILPFLPTAGATQADDTTITVSSQVAGPRPFIKKLNLDVSAIAALTGVEFKISPKPGSVTRPLTAKYTRAYLESRGYLTPSSGQVIVPVFGLYADYSNSVELTYSFRDGSSKTAVVTVTTPAFNDRCGFDNPTVLQARTQTTELSYDYMLVAGNCDSNSPRIIDTDGAVRWVGTANVSDIACAFRDNAIFIAGLEALYRMELDGAVTLVADYSDAGVLDFHHNIDPAKYGMMLEANTAEYFESTFLEVDNSGNVLKTWDLAESVRAAMIAGGDDPSDFVRPSPDDWFHSNSVVYRMFDDSLVISSRENFVIAIDYDTGAVKWILGDTTKSWYFYPSLRKFALDVPDGGLAPAGQHSVSFASDGSLLLHDNGFISWAHSPQGVFRPYAAGRKYKLDLQARTATEIWNFTHDETVHSPVCSSIYEDQPQNYLIDYAIVGGLNSPNQFAQLLGLAASGETVFEYRYPTTICAKAYRSLPVHLEGLLFTTPLPDKWSRGTASTLPAATARVAVDSTGASVVTGVFRGSSQAGPNRTLVSAGGDDLFVAKYDVGGGLLWARRGGGIDDDKGEDVKTDAQGNVYVVGSFSGAAAFESTPGKPGTTLTSAGGSDVFLLKYDADGRLAYARRAGGPGNDFGHGVAAKSKGICAITGEFVGSATFEGGASPLVVTGRAESDAFVARYDFNGAPTFVTKQPAFSSVTGEAAGMSIAFGELDASLNPNNYLYAAGRFARTSGSGDIFLLKLSPTGEMLWRIRAGGSGDDLVTSIATNSAGDSYITGAFSGSASFGSTVLNASGGTTGLFVARYDKNGALQFAVTNGGNGLTAGTGVALDLSGNPIVSGLFQGSVQFGSTSLSSSSGSEDGFLATLAPDTGAFRDATGFGTTAQNVATGVAIDGLGNIFKTGVQGSQSFINPGEYSNLSGANGFVQKLGKTLD